MVKKRARAAKTIVLERIPMEGRRWTRELDPAATCRREAPNGENGPELQPRSADVHAAVTQKRSGRPPPSTRPAYRSSRHKPQNYPQHLSVLRPLLELFLGEEGRGSIPIEIDAMHVVSGCCL